MLAVVVPLWRGSLPRSGRTLLALHSAEARDLALVIDLDLCEMLASARRSAGLASLTHGAGFLNVALANSSAFSFPDTIQLVGTQWMVTQLSRTSNRLQTSIAWMAGRWSGPTTSAPTRSMAAVKSTKNVNRWPFS